MTRNDGNAARVDENENYSNNGTGTRSGRRGMPQTQFSIEEVGKLVGSAVATALSENREWESQGQNSNGNQSNSVNNSNSDNSVGNSDSQGLRHNKDGSIDKRQFNNGQGDNSDANEPSQSDDWNGKTQNGENIDGSYINGTIDWIRDEKGIAQITTNDDRKIVINIDEIEGELEINKRVKFILQEDDTLKVIGE